MSELAKVERKKEKSQGFAALGIPVGATLVFKKNPEITVKTLDDKNKVEYQGKPYSISTLAKQLVGSPVSGYLYFKFEGETLKSLGKTDTPDIPEPADSHATVPAEEAAEAPDVSMEPEAGRNIDPVAGGMPADSAKPITDGEEAGECPKKVR